MELYEELLYLTRSDRELLKEKTHIVVYRANDILIKEGNRLAACSPSPAFPPGMSTE